MNSVLVTDTTKYDEKLQGVADPCTEASLFWGDQALTEVKNLPKVSPRSKKFLTKSFRTT